MDFPTGAGATGGPISPDAWKRAVYKAAPRNFYVKLLPPEKQGNSYSYGLRICPIKDDNISIISRSTSSGGSTGSVNEYDVWRRWEDCLWFQETLEVEYSRLAREKRNRLAAGKGVKKNGIYIQSDQAASFDSLPPGPDPHSVAQDIHAYVPKLTKKGTLFRASQATIDQRFEEFRAMIDALFGEDVPTLVKEIRATRTFTDFFGFWRRDQDLKKKTQQPHKELATSRTRASLSSSMFSAYFSASTPALSEILPSPSKGKQPAQRQPSLCASTHSDSSSSDGSVSPPKSRQLTADTGLKTPRATSSLGSRTTPSLPSTPVSSSRQLPATARQPIIVSQEAPIRFGHNPQVLASERPASILESLPEGRELSSSPMSDVDMDSKAWRRRRAGSIASDAHRKAKIYAAPPHSLSEYTEPPSDRTTPSPPRYSRYSWQTTHSSGSTRAAAYLAELDVDYHLPSPNPEHGHQPRASMCSMASVMTDSSFDSVTPCYPGPSPNWSSTNIMRRPRPASLMEEPWVDHGPWSEHDGHEQGDDILDAYFYDSIRPYSQTPSNQAETPTAMDGFPYITRHPEQHDAQGHNLGFVYPDRRRSLTTSVSSASTNSSLDPMSISIKAMHEDNIIMLRAPRHLSFEEVRQKLYDKFIQTGRSPISESFAMALLVPPPAERSGTGWPRAGSLSSLGSTDINKAVLHFITSQDEWDEVIAFQGTRILLRIIGSRE
ncbi:hypothetical protein PAXRUDRAFT_15530 [Paxillus rubicundulus Ve08.2h10]|uniref:PX domain-containing protein n=1 Tax=Paxillus rubicundulus Ve08.2h10 TaxID=930991 RepID=A0A0D0DPL9_9AGAM|nr:hypothetical protein PAXRUDRAFT_15530 [Paxillus rubicundulus Ve08.2h10]